MFTKFQKQQPSKVTFGDNGCRIILAIGKINKNLTSSIENIYFVDGLKYNLLSMTVTPLTS